MDTAASEAGKRRTALQLLDREDCVLSIQVLQEFYVQATRSSRANPVPHSVAVDLIEGWSRFRIQENSLVLLFAALQIRAQTGFAFWDCSIIAAAQLAGCDHLYSEDMSYGRRIGSVQIVNPFRSSRACRSRRRRACRPSGDSCPRRNRRRRTARTRRCRCTCRPSSRNAGRPS